VLRGHFLPADRRRLFFGSDLPRSKALLSAITLILVCTYLVSGVRYALYAPATSDNYLWAVYHVHSTMSDGLDSPVEIARQARMARVALVILTDHGNPNPAASAFHMRADGVTIVGGSEAKLPEGRLTFFGARQVPRFALASSPPRAIDQARLWGAFPIVSYTEDPLYGWHYWESDLAPGGIEVSNLFSCVRALSVFRKLLLALYYPFSQYYFLKSVAFPAQSFARWDDILERRKTWGLIAADAHGGFHLGKWFSARVPSYYATFSLAGLGIDRKYASQPEVAIRNGDFFNCIRGAGEPLVFDYFATNGASKFTSGSTVPEGSALHAKVQTAGQTVQLVLIKDGAIERRVDADHLDIPSLAAGVYRLEVYLPNHPLLPENVPWIVSNPIFIGTAPCNSQPRAVNSQAVEASRQASIGVDSGAVTAIR
jgi:hypothetical protein